MRGPVELPPARTYGPLVRLALDEDIGPGDATTRLVVPKDRLGVGLVEARERLVVCGLPIARRVLQEVDPALAVEILASEGSMAEPGEPLARVRGALHGILAGERTALNFLMRMCGVASTTRRFVAAVEGTGASIVDTRKTLPGWRALDKYATAVGGAQNHRVGLFDGILLKDNHVAAAGGVSLAVKTACAAAPANLRVQVEVESEPQALEAVSAGADFLLLDNCTPEQVRGIAARLQGRALLEVSGGVTLENVRDYAEAGVQRISIGALTHSAPSADVALELEIERAKPQEGRGGTHPGATAPGGVGS
jgi:nicotinate-nucleotide pyrophosphorylase (carboxylating)